MNLYITWAYALALFLTLVGSYAIGIFIGAQRVLRHPPRPGQPVQWNFRLFRFRFYFPREPFIFMPGLDKPASSQPPAPDEPAQEIYTPPPSSPPKKRGRRPLDIYDRAYEQGIALDLTLAEVRRRAKQESPEHFGSKVEADDDFDKAMISREKKGGKKLRRGG